MLCVAGIWWGREFICSSFPFVCKSWESAIADATDDRHASAERGLEEDALAQWRKGLSIGSERDPVGCDRTTELRVFRK